MRVIEAPEEALHADLFLAGGITGTWNWQQAAIALLSDTAGALFNPRRQGDFIPAYADEQIEWEYRALRRVDAILFWFPPETLCPITLYELGVWANQTATRICVGTDPAYARRFDVVKQLRLCAPTVRVHDSLEDVVEEYIRRSDAPKPTLQTQ